MCRLLDCCDHSGGEDTCWNWKGWTDKNGYACLKMPGKCDFAHRVMYATFHACELDPTIVIRHKCDNPMCINPRHLKTGTQANNVADMWERGRQQTYKEAARGSNCHLSKIDEDIARAIFAATGTCAKIAEQFGQKVGMIECIKRGETWSHATGFKRIDPRQPKPRINDETAILVYKAQGSSAEIARKMNLSPRVVESIKRGESFRNVTGLPKPNGPRRGCQNTKAKLTEENVKEILSNPQLPLSYFAYKFHVAKMTIRGVRLRVTWNHVTI